MAKFYYYTSDDYIVCGDWSSADAAFKAAIECGVSHTDSITILEKVGYSAPPNLTRKWKAV